MEKPLTTAEKDAIRGHFGHGEGNRKVKIKQNGEVHYYGSIDPFDREHDYWHFGGYVKDILNLV
jgi:hypothetical protein